MRGKARRWKVVALLAVGMAIGVTMTATPAASHVGGTVAHLWSHLKPLADARYANAVAGTDKAKNADKLDGRDSVAYLPGTLPANRSVTGAFYVMGPATAAGQFIGDDISFGYRTSAAIPFANRHFIKVGDPAVAACPGNVDDPQAAPGHICAYEGGTQNVGAFRGFDQFRATGTGVFIQSAAAGHTYSYGTWAMTAPPAGAALRSASPQSVAGAPTG
jgi:hypothetical protein